MVDAPGEWLVSLLDTDGEVAVFPLYVDRSTPQAAPLGGAPQRDAGADAGQQVGAWFGALDGWYDRARADHEAALDAVARVRLRQFLAGEKLPDASGQLAAAGYFEGAAGECQAANVQACLDAMWWSHSGHHALAGEWAAFGVATAPTATGGVAVSLTVAAALPPAF